MQISTATVAARSTKNTWSGSHSFSFRKPHGPGNGSPPENLIVTLSIQETPKNTEAANIGREILEKLTKGYFDPDSPEGKTTPFNKLVNITSRVSKEFAPLGLSLTTAVFWKNFVYLNSFGNCQVLLWRNQKLNRILKGTRSLSGVSEKGDVYIFGTKSFFDTVDVPYLINILSSPQSTQDIIDNLTPLIQKEDNPTLAVAAVKVLQTQAQQVVNLDKVSEEKNQATPSVKEKVSRFFSKATFFLASKLPNKDIRISRDEKKSKKTAASVGIILLLILIVSIIFGVRQKRLQEYRSTYTGRLTKAQELYNDAVIQKDLNPTLARSLFSEAQNITLSLLEEGIDDEKLNNLKTQLDADTAKILGKLLSKPELFLDLSLIRSGVLAKELILDGETLAILDRGGNRVITVSIEGRKTQVLGTTKRNNIQNIALYTNKVFALEEEGIIEIAKDKRVKVAIEKDAEWGIVAKIAAFGGNLYVLSNNGQIWRYPGTEDGFGSKKRWLGDSVKGLAQSKDFKIDGSIWVLAENGEIKKFTRGAPKAFNITGLDKELKNPKAIYTDENLESIYILDSENARIVEVNKKGEYQKQYLADEASDALDLAVSKEAGKAFLLTETKILEVSLE